MAARTVGPACGHFFLDVFVTWSGLWASFLVFVWLVWLCLSRRDLSEGISQLNKLFRILCAWCFHFFFNWLIYTYLILENKKLNNEFSQKKLQSSVLYFFCKPRWQEHVIQTWPTPNPAPSKLRREMNVYDIPLAYAMKWPAKGKTNEE